MQALKISAMESQLYELIHCLTKIKKEKIPLSPEVQTLMYDMLQTHPAEPSHKKPTHRI